jgi:plastocyanin
MHRFQNMYRYSASVVLLLVLMIAGATWLRHSKGGATPIDSSATAMSAEAMPSADPPASSAATAPTQAKISIDNFSFKPKALSVAVGATVTWVNHDDVPHTATSAGDQIVFDSKALDTDDTFSFTFTKPGTYRYYCKVHSHMTGTVVVK